MANKPSAWRRARRQQIFTGETVSEVKDGAPVEVKKKAPAKKKSTTKKVAK